MSEVSLLVLQPSEVDPPARLGGWLTAAGVRLDVRRLSGGDPVPTPDEVAGAGGVVCLGGAMGALDDVDFPWLAELRALLAGAVTRRTPVLGVCLGAQLLAAAAGGRVARAARPEVGPMLIARRDVALEDPLFGSLPLSPLVLQYHRDEVTVLPPGATLLAASPRCAHQAFRVGSRAWGLQGHIETTPELVRDWSRNSPDLAAHARPGALEHEHLVAEHEQLEQTWRPVVERFAELAARPPSVLGEPLPLSAAPARPRAPRG